MYGCKRFLSKQLHEPIIIHNNPHVHDPIIIHYCLQPEGQFSQQVHICKSDQGCVWTTTSRQDLTWWPHTTPCTVWIPLKKTYNRTMYIQHPPHKCHPGSRKFWREVCWKITRPSPQYSAGYKIQRNYILGWQTICWDITNLVLFQGNSITIHSRICPRVAPFLSKQQAQNISGLILTLDPTPVWK